LFLSGATILHFQQQWARVLYIVFHFPFSKTVTLIWV
jgi:hypothetical protein